jgi:hypothetical protein
MEKNQIQTGEIMEMSVANIKRSVYQDLLDKIINDEFASEKYQNRHNILRFKQKAPKRCQTAHFEGLIGFARTQDIVS